MKVSRIILPLLPAYLSFFLPNSAVSFKSACEIGENRIVTQISIYQKYNIVYKE